MTDGWGKERDAAEHLARPESQPTRAMSLPLSLSRDRRQPAGSMQGPRISQPTRSLQSALSISFLVGYRLGSDWENEDLRGGGTPSGEKAVECLAPAAALSFLPFLGQKQPAP